MPGYLLNMDCSVMCAHGGEPKPVASNSRVKVSKQPVPLISAPFVVSGCAFPPPIAGNGPCVIANWTSSSGTARVKSMGKALLVESSQATCVPTGTPVTISDAGQSRVKAK